MLRERERDSKALKEKLLSRGRLMGVIMVIMGNAVKERKKGENLKRGQILRKCFILNCSQ